MRLVAVRGAVTCDADTREEIEQQTRTLVSAMLERNGITDADLVSILFTATPDLTAQFPATAARALGLADVPLLGAQELAVHGAPARVIRVMLHAYSERARSEVEHVYLGGAVGLRADLAATDT